MIVPVEPKVCEGVRQYFESEGEIEVQRPSRCPRPKAECGSSEPMRKNGSYPRQVIYWGLLFVLSILRFRCGRCGKTVSRPYSWLVPYKRFSAEAIAAGVEAYATEESKYRELSPALSEPEFLEAERDIRQTKFYKKLSKTGEIKVAVTKDKGCRPSHCAIFYWVDFICKRIESVLQQVQKELVRRQKEIKMLPPESFVENANSRKAKSSIKAEALDRLSFVTVAGRLLLNERDRSWERLRAYFLTQAEHCKDLLTATPVRCQLHTLLDM
ncbi:MAG: hypothetical protein MN733_37945 [Nitrososphaera sp.]|nr:hypothetical protein [Nitrososphaera sp.]